MDFVSFEPMRLPIWVMELSEPKVKSPSPRIIMTVPMTKESIRSVDMGATVKHRTTTTSATGRTDTNASFSFFDSSLVRTKKSPPSGNVKCGITY